MTPPPPAVRRASFERVRGRHGSSATSLVRRDHPMLPLAAPALLALAALQLITTTANGFLINEGPAWNYQQQPHWHLNHRACSHRAQSPVDIKSDSVIFNANLKLQFYNYRRPASFLLENAHHTVKLSLLEQAANGGLGASPSDSSAGAAAEKLDTLPSDILAASAANETGAQPEAAEDSTSGEPGGEFEVDTVSTTEKPAFGRGSGARHDLEQADSAATPVASNSIEHEQDNQISTDEARPKGETKHQHQKLPYDGVPSIKLDWLDDGNNEYKLQDIHFHWGTRNNNGSEHAIDGKRAAMEMHLVHIRHGLDKSQVGYTSDALAVIAVLIEVRSTRKGNADLNPVVNALAKINASSRAEPVEYKSLYDILPSESPASFYTYSGSLTTPPCHQVVNWIVLTERVSMNSKQVELFRNLYSPQESAKSALHKGQSKPAAAADYHADDHQLNSHLMVPNNRDLQALNNRTVMASFGMSGKYGLAEAYSGAAPSVRLVAGDALGWWLPLLLVSFLVRGPSNRATTTF